MKTPLYEEHVRLGARMTTFAGWEMPLQYSGIAHEVSVVRTLAGLFDICHMGEFTVSGQGALELLQFVTTNDVSRLQIGQAQYSLLCNESGGVIDDLIVYRTGSDAYLLIVNASNRQEDFEWITTHNDFGAAVYDISDKTGLLAIQGPAVMDILQPVADFDLAGLRRFNIAEGNIAGIPCRAARTGYTGEDGFEVLCGWDDTVSLWKAIMDADKLSRLEPIGLGARDVLRLEMAYPLHGHEISKETTPVAARLMWVVKLSKGDFIGRDAIMRAKEEGPIDVLVGLEAIDRCIPRHASPIMRGDLEVGRVTSGTFSPTLGKGIAMAYVNTQFSEVGTVLDVAASGRSCACKVVDTPFYKAKTAAGTTAK